MKSGVIAEAYAQGDRLTRKVLKRAAKYTGAAVASLVNVLNPEMIVLGGGLVEAVGEDYLKDIRKCAKGNAFKSAMEDLRIVAAQLGDDAGIQGAAALLRDSL